MRLSIPLLAVAFALLLACSGEDSAPPAPGASAPPAASDAPPAAAPRAEVPPPPPAPAAPEPEDPDALVKRGRAIYMSTCIACHNADPSLAGAIGPANAGSSLELLKAKVLRNEYPEGYTPKRDTKLMTPFPHLEKDLPALEAFLAQAAG